MEITRPIVWQPVLGVDGLLHGVLLEATFARRCMNYELSKDAAEQVTARVWNVCKPRDWNKDYIPSDVIDWYQGSLLPQGMYHRHGSGGGDWLTLNTTCRASSPDDRYSVSYSFHHAEWYDLQPNLWLQMVFAYWAMFAALRLEAS